MRGLYSMFSSDHRSSVFPVAAVPNGLGIPCVHGVRQDVSGPGRTGSGQPRSQPDGGGRRSQRGSWGRPLSWWHSRDDLAHRQCGGGGRHHHHGVVRRPGRGIDAGAPQSSEVPVASILSVGSYCRRVSLGGPLRPDLSRIHKIYEVCVGEEASLALGRQISKRGDAPYLAPDEIPEIELRVQYPWGRVLRSYGGVPVWSLPPRFPSDLPS